MEFRSDRAEIKTWEITDEGYLQFLAPIAREGYLLYRDDAGVRREFVSAKTLRKTAHTFTKKPITIEHPSVPLNAGNARQHAVGWTANEAKLDENGVLWLSGTVFDSDAIESIRSGQTQEISCGYGAKIVDRGDGTFEQVSRQGNHVAAVSKGRAGSEVSFKFDSGEESLISQGVEDYSPLIKLPNPKHRKNMTYTAQLDGIAMEFESMDVAKHVKAIDSELQKLRVDADKNSDRLTQDSATISDLTTKITGLQSDLDTANQKGVEIQTKLDSLQAEHDDLTARTDSKEDVPPVDVAALISERMRIWNEALPFLRSDSADYEPDYSKSPIEVMAEVVAIAHPELANHISTLNLDDASSEGSGFVKGLYASINASQFTGKAKKRGALHVDSILDEIRSRREVEFGGDRLDAARQKRSDRIANNGLGGRK